MPSIEIRAAISSDIPALMAIEHHYTSEYVWQLDVQNTDGEVKVSFRRVRLPRPVRVEYPRSPRHLADEWTRRSGMLVAIYNNQPIGYTSLQLDIAPLATWMTDLVVLPRLRRQGIGSALVLAAQEWAADHATHRLVMEVQTKNDPAIRLAEKLGLELSGYQDDYFASYEIGLFFATPVR